MSSVFQYEFLAALVLGDISSETVTLLCANIVVWATDEQA